jgi:plasmid stability protein
MVARLHDRTFMAPVALDILSVEEEVCKWQAGFWAYGPIAAPCAIIDCSDIIAIMASITIRNLEETTKRKLKIRAAVHGRSMEQEAREILKDALHKSSKRPRTGADLAEAIRRRFAPLGGLDLELPPREPIRDPEWLKDLK